MCHESGDTDDAIDALRRLVEIDPVQEVAQRLLMSLLAESGRQRDALRQFSALTKALGELQVAPSAETKALREKILRGSVQRRCGVGWEPIARRVLGTESPTPPHGREAAVKEMAQFVADADGDGVLLVLGDAGVGKSRLVVEAARIASESGAVVMFAAGSDLHETPYLPFSDAWSEYLRCTGGDPSESPFVSFRSTRAGAADDKLHLFQTVESALEAIRGDGAVCLVIEDLHWLDESSLHLMHYLARKGRGTKLTLVATCRGEEIELGTALHTAIATLRRERLLKRIELEPLDRAATKLQIADLLGDSPTDAVVDEVFALGGGNAFFTEELVRSRQDGAGKGAITAVLADTVRGRVARLGADAETLLLAASVVGQRFDFDVACQVSGMDVDQALDALEAGLAANVVKEDLDGYRFHHALVRTSLYEELSRARRTHLHRRAADAIDARTPDAHEDLALHFRRGGQQQNAIEHLIAAGRDSLDRLGLREAVGFFEQALDLMDALDLAPGPERFEVLDRTAQALFALSDIEACVRHCDAAVALGGADGWRPSAGELARAHRFASLAHLTGGDLDASRARLEAAVRVLENDEDDSEWPEVLYHLAQVYWHEEKYQDSYDTAQRCLVAAERHDNPETIARGYEMLALACHSLGEWNRGLEFEEKRQSIAGASVDVAQSFDAHL